MLSRACGQVGWRTSGQEALRVGENAVFWLPGQGVARVSRPGQISVATREVSVSRWLHDQGVDVVRAVAGVANPVLVDDRAVTFWETLPPHRDGRPAEVARALLQLHGLPQPVGIGMEPLAPLVRLPERIDSAHTLPDRDRSWLREQLSALGDRLSVLDELPRCVVHGDAWGGNIVRTEDGRTVLLDLERCSVGPAEWDLTRAAVSATSLNFISSSEYAEYCGIYGHDVTRWLGYPVLRDVRELRMATYLAQLAADDPGLAPQAQHRVDCLRGRNGPRPWVWTAASGSAPSRR